MTMGRETVGCLEVVNLMYTYTRVHHSKDRMRKRVVVALDILAAQGHEVHRGGCLSTPSSAEGYLRRCQFLHGNCHTTIARFHLVLLPFDCDMRG
jgi:hypothetical protein